MRKIVFYINILDFGGAERVISNLANTFSNNGDKVYLVTTYKVENEYETIEAVERIYLFEKKPSESFIVKNYKCVRKLRKIIIEKSPDLVVSFMAEPNFRALFATFGINTKNVLSVRNDPNKEYPGKLGLLAKIIFAFADGIVFQTSDAKEWFPMRIQKKSKVIFNQVDEKFYIEYGNDSKSNIVSVGRMTEQKNFKNLIEAYSLISSQISEDLFIYGEGPLKEEIEKYIFDKKLVGRVHLMGTSKSLDLELEKYRVFVLSSDYEGMPNCLMEAMAKGLACIATDCPCGGPRELFGECNKSYLVKTNDSIELAKVLNQLLTNNEMLISNVEGMKKQSLLFRPQIIFSEWDNYFEKIINK